jgi:hypothetical protein
VDFVVVALTFAAIFVVELPDKTFIATLVLSTKFRPLFVWIGVGLAFLAQTLVAVGLGTAASFLPETVVHVAASVMFLIGAIILVRRLGHTRLPRARRRRTSPPRPGRRRASRSSRPASWCCSPPSGATCHSC